mmetsp:Transcript_62383/g.135436  ORF Transcript_62383/g.135436 Transcript_62383/m.135436 type:complete len:241 (-) Transcript_62383:1967-2689(-)
MCLSAVSKKATKPSREISSLAFAPRSSASASSSRFLSCLLKRITLMAEAASFLISSAFLFAMSALRRTETVVRRLTRVSMRPMRDRSGFVSAVTMDLRLSSMPSLREKSFFRASSTVALRPSTISSASSSIGISSECASAFFSRGCVCFSTLLTSLSAAMTTAETSLTFSTRAALNFLLLASCCSRSAVLFLFRAHSRATPIAAFMRWNSSNLTPFWPAMLVQMLARDSFGTLNLNSPSA